MTDLPAIKTQMVRQAERLAPRRNEVVSPERTAEATFNRIVAYIREFEANMDAEHEVGARMVSFGDTVQFTSSTWVTGTRTSSPSTGSTKPAGG